ncbi:hypothetical protein [Francisella sp. SYW-9]|uniref:hypothetical protein n=1 Tax=Francisella sp. SYW-9 TaxID=2610888 RepID=UPI00123D4A15|nr:hypothetical protein [Francisella sp. SYW-9]
MNDCKSIQHEISEFLNFQIHGKCSANCSCKLTKIDLTVKAKNLLKPIRDVIYFGDEKLHFSEPEMDEVHHILTELKNQVSTNETILIDYIFLVVDNCKNKAKFEALKATYQRSIVSNS